MRKSRSFATAVAIAVTATALSAAPSADAASSSSQAPKARILITTSGTASFTQDVLGAVSQRPSLRPQAVRVLRGMLASTTAGKNLHLPGSRSMAQQRSDVDSTLAALTSNQPSTPAPQNQSGTPNVAVSPAAASPSNYPKRGAAANNNRSWKFTEAVGDVDCGGGGCLQLDLITCHWTIDPGRSADRMSFTCLYSPNRGNYSNIYANGYSFCNGGSRQCGTLAFPPGPPRNGTGSDTYSVKHADTAGQEIKDGISLHGYNRVTKTTKYDKAGTGLAECQTGTGRNCIY